MEQTNNTTMQPSNNETIEIKPGRDYEIQEVTMAGASDFSAGDMLIFKKDMSEKGWEFFKSFLTESASFKTKHRVDEPGEPSWNEFAKFFCREFAWAAENILNGNQLRIKNIKNRLKRKVITLPVDCVLIRQIKN